MMWQLPAVAQIVDPLLVCFGKMGVQECGQFDALKILADFPVLDANPLNAAASLLRDTAKRICGRG